MNKEINIKQHDKTDCAAACLSSICTYYGLELPLISIREACGTSLDGTNLKGIIDAANKLGLISSPLKSRTKEIDDLENIYEPVILHLNKLNGWLHFIVLYKYGKKKCQIMDPEDGKISYIKTNDLKAEWSGYLLILKPGANFKKEKKREKSYIRFLRIFSNNKKELIHSLVGAIAYIICGLSTSVFLQQIIDKILPKEDLSMLSIFAITMLLITLVSLIINYMRSLFTIKIGIKIDSQLILSYIQKLLSLPVSFFKNRSAGELNSRITDAYRIRSFISGELIIIAISIFSLIISFCLLFSYYWKLAMIVLLFIPLYILIYKISGKIYKKLNKQIIESSAKFQEENIEMLETINTIRYYGANELFYNKLEKLYVKMNQNMYKGAKYRSIFTAAGDSVTMLLSTSTLIIGSFYIFNNNLSIGELVSFFTIVSFLTSPIMALIESNESISEAKISVDRLFEIMDLDSEDAQESLPSYLTNNSLGDIIIDNISFTFPGQLSLFNNFSCKLLANKINLIIGDNGSGKSTLASFLLRAFKPDSGKIIINDLDIFQTPINEWREIISIVPQTIELFNSSILDNITLKKYADNLEKIINACKESGIWDYINRQPDGLLSKLGANGSKLSGGEKQKLALARALYRNPKILILDEASTALDKKSKKEFIQIIKSLIKKNLTIIIISHEDDFLEIADNIIEIKGCAS